VLWPFAKKRDGVLKALLYFGGLVNCSLLLVGVLH
jgi:hypothetical protein